MTKLTKRKWTVSGMKLVDTYLPLRQLCISHFRPEWFRFRPGFPGGPGIPCGPRLGLPLPPPPFLDFYGMPGGLDGNYRKVNVQSMIINIHHQLPERSEKHAVNVFHVNERITVGPVSTVLTAPRVNKFVSIESATH